MTITGTRGSTPQGSRRLHTGNWRRRGESGRTEDRGVFEGVGFPSSLKSYCLRGGPKKDRRNSRFGYRDFGSILQNILYQTSQSL